MPASLTLTDIRVPWLAAWLSLLLLVAASTVRAQVALPTLAEPVTDTTGTLSAQQIAALTQKIRALESSNGARVAIVVLLTTAPESIEEFAIRLAEARKLGRQGIDDGVLVILAKQDRAARIEVGPGLQGALPDVLANRITDQVMVARFREGDYFGGLDAGLDRIVALVKGEPLPAAPQRPSAKSKGIGSVLPVLLMFVFFVGGALRRALGRVAGSASTAGIAGALAWLVSGAVSIGVLAAGAMFFFSLFGSDRMGGWSSGRGGRFGGGLGGGGFGGGGFGGGSWGGGGGTFNGGGATGRW